MNEARRPSERSFGLSVGAASLLAGGASWWRGHGTAAIGLTVAGVLLLGGGLLAPAMLRVPNRLWWRFAQALGWINTRVLLTAFFVIVLTPVGIVMRLLGRGPLRPPQSATTWSSYDARRRDAHHYKRMF
jgi:hypothetical protein